MVRKGLFDWLTTVTLDDFGVLSETSKDLSCMLDSADLAVKDTERMRILKVRGFECCVVPSELKPLYTIPLFYKSQASSLAP